MRHIRLNRTRAGRLCRGVFAHPAPRGMLRAGTQERGQGDVCGESLAVTPTEVDGPEDLAFDG